MPNALIIGASRGIGREFAQQLLADGWKVYATARDDAAIAALKAAGADALKLDVTRPESLATLEWQLDGLKLDLALYVAGVYGPQQDALEAPTTDAFDNVMHANVLGAMQVMPTVAPMVEAARGKFIFLSSGLGSIAEAESSYAWVYRASKAALNMAVKSASFDYPKAILLAMSPGWVKTDMGGQDAPLSVTQSVNGMRRVINALAMKDSGGYRGHDGRHIPW
jgi:NAD(P)-dependent dehydrogenase (short-subunit alcohol dehydrogenase family)